ncbi:MAG TPA: T9SS type A sorting domain-containing protein [Ignavibacteria bacterium]
MKKVVFLLLIIHCSLIIANAQWVQTNGPCGGSFTCFASNNNYLFAGTWGYGVVRSTNNGKKWTYLCYGSLPYNIYSIAVSDSIIYAGSQEGILYSNNNGNNWVMANSGLTSPYNIYSLLISGQNVFAGTYYGVFTTTNSGSNWIITGVNNQTYSLIKSDANFYAGAQGGVYRSTNNGVNWILTSLNNIIVYSLSASTDNIFAGTYYNGIYKSTNDGANWISVNNGLTRQSFPSVAISGIYVFAGSYGGGLFRSSNNGASWNCIGFLNKDVISLFVKSSKIYSGLEDYGSFLSTDNGLNWDLSGLNCRTVNDLCLSDSVLYAGAFDTYNSYLGDIFISTNNGISWNPMDTTLTTSVLYCIAKSGPIILAGSGVGVYRSTNNGLNWRFSGLYSLNVTKLLFSGTSLYAGTFNGIYRSRDNGANWRDMSFGLTNDTIHTFASSETNIFAGTSGGIFRCPINDTIWTPINNGLNSLRIRALAISGTTIFAGTSNAGVFRSVNNGENWTAIGLTNQYVSSIVASGANIFAGTQYENGVFYSSNKGANWIQINQGFNNADVNCLLISGNHIFAGIGNNSVWKRPLMEIIGIKPINTIIPDKYNLYQNYPNPFNPSTKIKFDIRAGVRSQESEVKLIIYDITGREIQTLVNEKLNPGTYEVTFDGSNFASGVYFYQLRSSDYVNTKKFIVLK